MADSRSVGNTKTHARGIFSLEVNVLDQMQIGKFIAELRKEKNMTQAQLGERLGEPQT